MDLHCAIYHGELGVAEELIRSGIDVNAKDNFGNTPLARALYDWHFGLARLLIEFGANVNSVNDNGISLLNEAVIDNNVHGVDFLIQHGAHLNLKSNNILPLDHALIRNHTNIVQTLIDNGGSSDTTRLSGRRRAREDEED